MKQGDFIRTTTDNLPHWKRGMKAEIVSREGAGYLADFGEAGQHVVLWGQLAEAVMKLEISDGVEIWVCTKEDANELFRLYRSESWRIWTFEECSQRMLDTKEELADVLEKKKVRPGPYLKP